MSKNFSFSNTPSIHMKRSQFPLSYNYQTMLNLGDIIPVYCQEILPGDTFKVNSNVVIRTTSPFIRPMMGNLFCDVYYFFVPNRIIDTHFEELMGDNKSSYWTPASTGSAPKITGVVGKNTIADYFGIQPGDYRTVLIGSLPFYFNEHRLRAYAQIWNDWYRCEALQAPVLINKGTGISLNGQFNSNDWATNNITGKPAKACKIYDYFTACLLDPQRGNSVLVKGSGKVPVDAGNDLHSVSGTSWHNLNGGTGQLGLNGGELMKNTTSFTGTGQVTFDNIWSNIDNVGLFTINDLRFATQLQKSLEKDARSGGRYIEQIYSKFGVVSPDARLQRSELLGGYRFPISMQQVAQTSKSETTSPMAQVSAYSLTNGKSGFSKGFVEHGFVIGLACIRQQHCYQNSIEKSWHRFDRYDYYEPTFANIGEQPVFNWELDAGNAFSSGSETQAFGYNEAWADYRYHPNMITGSLRTSANEGFDIWHLGDHYSTPITAINGTWIQETPVFLDRVLSVPSTTAPQFILDCYNDVVATRCMPIHSIPGKLDHN